jgi:hypothetical protein
MVAALGVEYLKAGLFSSMDLTAEPNLKIGKNRE